jgi:hypothetical protein
MIFHVSIEAEQPQQVAAAIAELWGGKVMRLDRLVEGSWIAFGADPLSSVEVFPQGTDITEAEGDRPWVGPCNSGVRPTATHVALGTNLTREQVFAVALREGWHAKFAMRGDRFGVIEMWISRHLMIEWLTPEMQKPYARTVQGMIDGTVP